MLADAFFICASFWGAMLVRFDSSDILTDNRYWLLLSVLIPITIFANIKLGLYRAVIRYITSKATISIVLAVIVSTLALIILSFYLTTHVPRTIPIIYAAFLLLMVGGSRLMVRALLANPSSKLKEAVIIYGAGSSGRQLALSLQQGNEYQPVAFIDDDKKLQGTEILGLKVYNRKAIAPIIKANNVKRILLAMPKESKKRIAKVLSKLENLSVEILSIPGSADLVSGKAKIDELQEVAIDDLLGRDPVEPNKALLAANIKNKVVMVTALSVDINTKVSTCASIAASAVANVPKTLFLTPSTTLCSTTGTCL
jgi:FlaA1/EpsC-like NDP-sugar epimerase